MQGEPGTSQYILLRASEVGSPANHLGSGQRQDTCQGSFIPLTGGLDRLLKIEKYGSTITDYGPVLLRQGYLGMSQYFLF